MTERDEYLGKLVAVHVIAPAYLQRAVFIVVLSFVFFMAMMIAFYVRQNIVYFLLASAFLIVYLVTLFSWLMQRRSRIEVFENGFKFKKHVVRWDEIGEVMPEGEIVYEGDRRLTIPRTINDFAGVVRFLGRKARNRG